ncbi:hypothetical protein GCM10010912_57710 [Paenibacillus albidus]|uniref:Uncharacterized protein n=1 Tax=Paenibacillus albidus TaxID=2041023 RepID=A0A917FVM4_9BACL|nr:hypothetical protein GCM10010912_57710 [Paenibacillus albidus]
MAERRGPQGQALPDPRGRKSPPESREKPVLPALPETRVHPENPGKARLD